MEWSGWQQIMFLLECIPCGVILGIVFEVVSSFVRCSARKATRFILDGAYGVLAAFLTFFCALVIMDGQLHPVLFLGILFGFVCEHFTIGRLVEWGMVSLIRLARQFCGYVNRLQVLVCRTIRIIVNRLQQRFPIKTKSNQKNL